MKTVGGVNKSKSPSAKGELVAQEKQRIQSPEFTQNLIASFHRSKRRALAEAKQNAVQKD